MFDHSNKVFKWVFTLEEHISLFIKQKQMNSAYISKTLPTQTYTTPEAQSTKISYPFHGASPNQKSNYSAICYIKRLQ